jgi:uncharacterized protein (TIGR03083 family)
VNHLLDVVLADLAAEGDRLDALVADLSDEGWRTPTPAAGWDVATQVAHLAWTDAHDFCLLVTQRVHRDDTDLVAQGRDATAWLSIAQAFAGPPGEGREPR